VCAQVITTRSAESIYLPTVLISGINAIFWSSYALAIKDLYILIPNAIGAALCAAQAALCIVFGKGASRSDNKSPSATDEQAFD
jgi:solute carrier family 50 protein (sugar transporter)